MRDIKKLITQGISIIIKQEVTYLTPMNPQISQLCSISNQLISLLHGLQPQITESLNHAVSTINNNGYVSAFSYGELRACYHMLKSIYMPTTSKKIFISHSSEDKDIINGFINMILKLGCGFKRDEIFCTLNHTAIRTGDDFRNEIIKNMKDCDFILCMISENFKRSEVCANEMGAIWAIEGKRILPFKFPNISFKEIGFLNVVKQSADITDKSKLDELYNELLNYYGMAPDWINYNQQTADFIQLVNDKIMLEYTPKYDDMFSAVSSVKSLCKMALSEIEEITKTDYNQIILELVKEYSNELYVVAEAISPHKQQYCLVSYDGLIGSCYKRGETIMENNVKESDNYFCAVPETESEICIPIIHDNHVYGVINSESENKNYFSAKSKKILEELAQAFARKLYNLEWSKKPSNISWGKLKKEPRYRIKNHIT